MSTIDYSEKIPNNVNLAGNGTEEIRTWLMARGVAGPDARFDGFFYKPLTTWYTGIALAEWQRD